MTQAFLSRLVAYTGIAVGIGLISYQTFLLTQFGHVILGLLTMFLAIAIGCDLATYRGKHNDIARNDSWEESHVTS